MSKHTLGPWMINGYAIEEVKEPSKTIAYLGAKDEGLTAGEVVANARLIAAAPELLEACKESLKGFQVLKDYMEKVGVDGLFTKKCVEILEHAILKAEGKEG